MYCCLWGTPCTRCLWRAVTRFRGQTNNNRKSRDVTVKRSDSHAGRGSSRCAALGRSYAAWLSCEGLAGEGWSAQLSPVT